MEVKYQKEKRLNISKICNFWNDLLRGEGMINIKIYKYIDKYNYQKIWMINKVCFCFEKNKSISRNY